MKGLLRSVLVVLIGSWAQLGVAAETETYAGIDIASMTVAFPASRTTPEIDHTELVVRGRIGAVLFPDSFPGLSVEAHLGMGVQDGEQVTFSYVNTDLVNPETVSRTTELELETLIGIYIRADMFAIDRTSFYGSLGFASVQSQPRYYQHASSSRGNDGNIVAGETIFGNETETESSISVALGVTYTINNDMTLQAEYINLVNGDTEDGFDVSGFSMGVNFALP